MSILKKSGVKCELLTTFNIFSDSIIDIGGVQEKLENRIASDFQLERLKRRKKMCLNLNSQLSKWMKLSALKLSHTKKFTCNYLISNLIV